MAALPYMQLYVADYLGDTYFLTTEEHGAYLLLIMTYWQSGKPIHKSNLARASRLNDERWTNVERTLNRFFEEDEDGYWIHYRIEDDLKKVTSKSIKASKAGKASAAKRAKEAIESKEESNECSTDDQQEKDSVLNHTEAEANTEAEAIDQKNSKTPSSRSTIRPQDVVDLFHEILPELPTVIKITKTRASHIKARSREDLKDLDTWRWYFNKVRESKFLMGMAGSYGDRRPFMATLDWLIKEANAVKVAEDRYNDGGQ